MTAPLPALALALFASVAAPLCWSAPVLKGPPPREITDPASVASAKLDGAAPAPIADLFYVRGGAEGVWTRDGREVVISTNLTGRYNLWKLSADGGFPLQLTQSDDRQSGLATSPDGAWVVYQSDHAGDEIYDLHAAPLAGGPPVDLTSTSDISETGAVFAPDGKTLALDRRLKTAPSTDVAILDLATRQVRLLTHETAPDQSWTAVAFTGDGKRLIANRANFAGTRSRVWSLDVATGVATPLTAEGGFATASDVSPDGRLIAVTVELADGRRAASVLDLATGHTRSLMDSPWEQETGRFSPDGADLVFLVNEDGRRRLLIDHLADGRQGAIPAEPGVDADAADRQTSFSPDGRRFLYIHQASNTAPEFWVADLASGKAAPITHLGLASLDSRRVPAARIVHYASADGTVISALLWTPFNLSRNGKAPAVVIPHGGPTGQTLDTFNRTAIALATRGYMVIAPNPRGSTGYGRAFEEANRKDLGGGDLIDEVQGAKFMAATGYVDAGRIGITGGSYGGYMTLMAAAKTPDLWAAAVEEYGIIDWFAMYASEAPTLQQYQMGLIGDPVKDKAVYQAASPLTYIHALKAPLLVLQGDNDIRVPKGQALEVIDLLKKDGRTVDAHFYANEGHGFVKRENQIDALERTVAWFETYLKGAKP